MTQKIRVIVLGLIRRDDRLFVGEGYDPIKQQTFYRALGGGVNFGETSLAALKREFWEELHTELTNIRYLGCLENLFTFNGQPGHELVQLYQCDFAEPKFYQLESLTFLEDSNQNYTALWVEIEQFRAGKLHLVPEATLGYL